MFTTQSLIFRRFAIIQSASVRLSSIKQICFGPVFGFSIFSKNVQLSLKFNFKFSFLIKWIKVSKAHMEGMGISLLSLECQSRNVLYCKRVKNKLKICSILLHYLDNLTHFSNGVTFVCRYMVFSRNRFDSMKSWSADICRSLMKCCNIIIKICGSI